MQDQGTCTHCDVLIPAEVVELLRDGLRGRLGVAAQRIAGAEERPDAREHPERYRDPLRCMDALRALLEDIGWSTPPGDPPEDLRVDLRIHGWALIEALRAQLSVHAGMLREIDRDDERGATLARDLNTLSTLALLVLLRTHAHAPAPPN